LRLLQLATGPHELIDLHPNVSVVSGLDDEGRRRLIETIVGLSRGRATGPPALLEAHGVLFDLTPEMLALLDIEADDSWPVVTAADLPTAGDEPLARQRTTAQRTLAEVEARMATASEARARAEAALGASMETVDRARRAVEGSDPDAPSGIQSIDSLTALLDHAVERRRRLAEELAELAPRAAEASAERDAVEAATADVRNRRREATVRCSQVAARREQARMERDPEAAAEAERAAAVLARVEAEVEAERQAEAEVAAPTEPLAARLAEVQDRIEELDQHLAAFSPVEVDQVDHALERVRSLAVGEQVPLPEALAVADQLAALEGRLDLSVGLAEVPGELAAGRNRLDEARQALLEAERAVRSPELAREVVERLERGHADLLDAVDRADRRFAGARAQQRVEELRAAENALLAEMGFASYSDYMMGSSLFHADPAAEAALGAARVELASAEVAWRSLQAETEAELARAEVIERRRGLLEEARTLLGRSVPADAVVGELRALRVAARVPPEALRDLRHALEVGGLALDEDIDPEDLVVVADAWVAEAGQATIRERELLAERLALAEERTEVAGALDVALARAEAPTGAAAEELRQGRLDAARAEVLATEERRRAHEEAEASLAALDDEMAEAVEAEGVAAEAAAEAHQAVATAAAEGEALLVELRRIEQELEAATRAEAEADERLRLVSETDGASSPDWLAHAVATYRADEEAAAETARALAGLAAQRQQAADALASAGGSTGSARLAAGAVADEVEWYLLARLAAQRSASLGGSLPLLVDDALTGLDEEELGHVLGRLERMAEAVQVIVVTDDPLASEWALQTGVDRAALVRPQPA